MVKITENEIKNILKKHKLLKESVEIDDIVTSDISKDSKNFKSFVEFLNGNIEIDDIADDIESFVKKIVDKTTDIEVGSKYASDDDFYKEVLTGVGAEPTKENLKFFYAWRQAEGAKAKFNPFNTTHKKDGSSLWNCLKKKGEKCVGGVRNYKSEQDGIDATVSTLKNGYYPCIVDGLKNDIGAKNIASKCSANLKTWGTGNLITKVLSGSKLNPPAISRTEVKKVD